MLIDYLANRKLLNNNVAGKSIKKEHFLAGNVRLWGKRKHHFRLIDNPLFCVSLFCPNPQSFDMRDKKKMLDSAFQLATSGLDPNCHSWICFSFYETTRNFFGARFAGSN